MCILNVILEGGLSPHRGMELEIGDSFIATKLQGQVLGAVGWCNHVALELQTLRVACMGKCNGTIHGSVLDPKSIWEKLEVTSSQRQLLTIPSSECKAVALSCIGSKVSDF